MTMRIESNAVLTSLEGLNSLTGVGGRLFIDLNLRRHQS